MQFKMYFKIRLKQIKILKKTVKQYDSAVCRTTSSLLLFCGIHDTVLYSMKFSNFVPLGMELVPQKHQETSHPVAAICLKKCH